MPPDVDLDLMADSSLPATSQHHSLEQQHTGAQHQPARSAGASKARASTAQQQPQQAGEQQAAWCVAGRLSGHARQHACVLLETHVTASHAEGAGDQEEVQRCQQELLMSCIKVRPHIYTLAATQVQACCWRALMLNDYMARSH